MDPVDLSSSLSVYGPLGILALLAVLSCWKLYRDRERERRAFAKERKELLDEQNRLEDRYVTKAEMWMLKYEEFAKAANSVIEAVMRRYRGKNGAPDDRE